MAFSVTPAHFEAAQTIHETKTTLQVDPQLALDLIHLGWVTGEPDTGHRLTGAGWDAVFGS